MRIFFYLFLCITFATLQANIPDHFRQTVHEHAQAMIDAGASEQDTIVLINIFYYQYLCSIAAVQHMRAIEKYCHTVSTLTCHTITPDIISTIMLQHTDLKQSTEQYEYLKSYYNYLLDALDAGTFLHDNSVLKTHTLEHVAEKRLALMQEWALEHCNSIHTELHHSTDTITALVSRLHIAANFFAGLTQELTDHPDQACQILSTSSNIVSYNKDLSTQIITASRSLEKLYEDFLLFSAQLDWYYFAYFYTYAQSLYGNTIPALIEHTHHDNDMIANISDPETVNLSTILHDAY